MVTSLSQLNNFLQVYPIELVTMLMFSISYSLQHILSTQVFLVIPLFVHRSVVLLRRPSNSPTKTLYSPQDTFWRHNSAGCGSFSEFLTSYLWEDCCFHFDVFTSVPNLPALFFKALTFLFRTLQISQTSTPLVV